MAARANKNCRIIFLPPAPAPAQNNKLKEACLEETSNMNETMTFN